MGNEFNDVLAAAVNEAIDKRLCQDDNNEVADTTPAPVVEETSSKAIEGKASSGAITLSVAARVILG